MCGLYGQIDSVNSVLEDLDAEPVDGETSNSLEAKTMRHDSAFGAMSLIVLDLGEVRRKAITATLGYRPEWSDKLAMNARAEGNYNKDDDPAYMGEMGIWEKPYYRDAIKVRRALLPVGYFVEGPKKERLKKPYVVSRKDGEVFTLAAVYCNYIDEKTGKDVRGFAIVTTAPNSLMDKIGHHRCPVLIRRDDREAWLDPTTARVEVDRMMRPWKATGFYAYPVDPRIHPARYAKRDGKDASEFMKPIGHPLFPDDDIDALDDKIWRDIENSAPEQGELF